MIRTRFAPSPTGLLQLGNIRTALFSYLFAHAQGGSFHLRIEDTDEQRSLPEYSQALLQDLEWMGCHWEAEPVYQSHREAIYAEYYARLEKEDAIYPCYCSPEKLAQSRARQLQQKKAPRYEGTCAHLSAAERSAHEQAGIEPSWRFRVGTGTLSFVDGVQGLKSFALNSIGDFVIRRSGDGSASFLFSNAVDDALMEISHVIRGDDHVTNTPRQLLILQALGFQAPAYAHLPLIVGTDGKPLSKRNGSQTLQSLREQGILPMALWNYLGRVGHYYAETGYLSKESLIHSFSMERIGHAAALMDQEQLKYWQHQAIMHSDVSTLQHWVQDSAHRLPEAAMTDAFLEMVRPNIHSPKEAWFWWQAIHLSPLERLGESYQSYYVDNSAKKAELLAMAQALLAYCKRTTAWHYPDIIQALKETTALPSKALFKGLRWMLTGVDHGPELAAILHWIGPEHAEHRAQAWQEVLA